MKKRYQRIKRSIITVMMAALMVIVNGIPVMAQENIDDNVFVEYTEKKEEGLEVYELKDDEGNFMGYYEPYSESNPDPNEGIMPHPVLGIDWIVDPGSIALGDQQHIIIKGMKMEVRIAQNRFGKSYLVVRRLDTNTIFRVNGSETMNGWNGTITFQPGLYPGGYLFGIENASSMQISYNGIYSI